MAEQSKVLLISRIDQARAGMTRTASKLRNDLDLPQHLRGSFDNHKGAWIGGAAALGWVIARLPGRRRQKRVEPEWPQPNGKHNGAPARRYALGGVLLALLRMALTALKPAITAVATRKIKDMAVERIRW